MRSEFRISIIITALGLLLPLHSSPSITSRPGSSRLLTSLAASPTEPGLRRDGEEWSESESLWPPWFRSLRFLVTSLHSTAPLRPVPLRSHCVSLRSTGLRRVLRGEGMEPNDTRRKGSERRVGSVCKVGTQDPENLDEELKPLVTVWSVPSAFRRLVMFGPFLSASSHSLPSSSRFVSLRSSPVPTSVTSEAQPSEWHEEGTGGSETGTGRDQPLHTRPFVSPYVRSSGLMLHG